MKQNLHKLLAVLFLAGFIQISLSGQDVNLTQYEMAPVFTNPGNTGGFFGTYRIGGIYRDRAPSLAGAYKTLDLAIETNFSFAFRKKDWTSLAITLLDDRSGEINFGKGGFLAAGAYHLVLGKGNLAIGAQYGGVSLSAKSPEKANFAEELGPLATTNSQDQTKLNSAKASYNDISAGLVYTLPMAKSKNLLKLGVEVSHINKPAATVEGTGAVNKLDRIISANISMQFHLSNKTNLIPMIWSRNITATSETVPQCMLSYLFSEEKRVRLNAGLGYAFTNNQNALQVMAGMDYGDVKVQVGYDLPTSSIAGLNAFEIGVIYVGSVAKKLDPKPKVFCPRF